MIVASVSVVVAIVVIWFTIRKAGSHTELDATLIYGSLFVIGVGTVYIGFSVFANAWLLGLLLIIFGIVALSLFVYYRYFDSQEGKQFS